MKKIEIDKKSENNVDNTDINDINHVYSINQIRITRTLFDEGMRASESGAYKKAIRKMVLVLAVIYLAVAAWLLYTGGALIFLLGESVFLGALLFWLTVMLPGTRRKSKYKAMRQEEDKIPERKVEFYQNYLSVTTDTGKKTRIPYTAMQDWKETKHLYILNCENHISVLLDKNGFTKGDFPIIKSLIFTDK